MCVFLQFILLSAERAAVPLSFLAYKYIRFDFFFALQNIMNNLSEHRSCECEREIRKFSYHQLYCTNRTRESKKKENILCLYGKKVNVDLFGLNLQQSKVKRMNV